MGQMYIITYISFQIKYMCLCMCTTFLDRYVMWIYSHPKTHQYTLILLTYMVATYKQSSYILLTYSMLYLMFSTRECMYVKIKYGLISNIHANITKFSRNIAYSRSHFCMPHKNLHAYHPNLLYSSIII